MKVGPKSPSKNGVKRIILLERRHLWFDERSGKDIYGEYRAMSLLCSQIFRKWKSSAMEHSMPHAQQAGPFLAAGESTFPTPPQIQCEVSGQTLLAVGAAMSLE